MSAQYSKQSLMSWIAWISIEVTAQMGILMHALWVTEWMIWDGGCRSEGIQTTKWRQVSMMHGKYLKYDTKLI